MAVLFFDIGATLASVKIAANGSLTLQPLPRVTEVLDSFPRLRKGIISNPGPGDVARTNASTALATTFGAYFNDVKLIHWGPKLSRGIFDNAVTSTGGSSDDCIFVGEDPHERKLAHDAGLRTVPHPVFSLAAIERRPVFWIRINVPVNRSLVDLETVANSNEVVPAHVGSDSLILAAATAHGVAALEQGGFSVDVRGRIDETTAYLLRDDRKVSMPASFAGSNEDKENMENSIRAAAAFSFISSQFSGLTAVVTSLGAVAGGVYLAAAPGIPIDELHIPGAKHGHTEILLLDPGLLSRPGMAAAKGLIAGYEAGGPSEETLTAVRKAITSEVIRGYVARMTGIDAIIEGEELKVRSRDIGSDHNMLVVDALGRRLQAIGLAVRLDDFSLRGKRLANLEAEYRVKDSDAIVLITAHLDSTAAGGEYFDVNGLPRRYDPASDPAPGADDDASGMAAVMAAAECLAAIIAAGRMPTRTMRFVLFNAEEQGLVGSKVYARAAAAAGEQIAGVFQMDMIGGFQGGTRKVEIHAGSAVSGPVISASNSLGGFVARAINAVAPTFEVESLTGPADKAIGRSDHASFQERGWAAVAISENFFDDMTPGTGTRQYHKPGDTLNDRDHNTHYAAEIARGVTAAALTLAGL